ncbi:two-partner secretion domain-containing protein [Roseobacter sp. CCS2]|uniref:two-partner secretion domain-containing protein n=1 Tax=Roseobacter sp. CCS2 TaxID=391593 RepID=UPI0000F3F12B|nr:filamentous hemagglutinin N-terminal domain-containing protein [Roseobacter sp. CCS2]EBA11188.1 Adhesin HecA 20-residue repeat x2 [Roseobacter sp. CCS2]
MTRKMTKYLNNAVSALCIALISAQPVMAQSIVADGNGPQVIDTRNGTPMVMINTPGAGGLSHNTFTEFGVGPGGAILNNVDTDTAMTNLGGLVHGNSNLRGGAANIILNEVTSSNPSVLNGFLEVAGQRADVIVANPNGITCDGCGFINTNRGTLTTGTPTIQGSNLTGFSVDGGAVQIGRGGLDASDTTTFDLISRQITVAGAVTGQRIRVVAGRNDVLYATGEITEKEDNGTTVPELAIDSTAFGGMFANSITITSTEDGVGVRAPENMAANAGGMTITADGRLVMNSATASQNVTVTSTDRVEVQGNVVAQTVDVTSAEDLVLQANAKLIAESAAILAVGGDLNVGTNAEIAANRFDFDVAGAFRVGNGADVVSVQTADIDAGSLHSFGTLASTDGALLVTTSLDLTNEGLMFGDTGVTLASDASILNNGGSIIANGNITIRGETNARAAAFTNQFGGVVETIAGDISISAVSFGNLRDGPILADGVRTDGDPADAVCDGDTCYTEIRNTGQITYDYDPSRIISARNITISAGDAVNAFSTISAFGNINIAANSLTNVGQNYYRDNGVGSLEFIGADFGVIEAGGTINGTTITGYVINGAETALASPAELTGSTNTDISDIDVDSIGNPDLIVVNVDPDAEFLVETRTEFVDLGQFLSSDYFLDIIQYDPDLKRFGDAYAEALFIRKQLQELLGQLILTTGIDEKAQIQAMYDNAINALENLDLTPGVALTPNQIGALTSDIIWLEETVIDGQTVLAPKVYLANPEIRFAGLSGAMITGQNVNFRTDNFDNSGSIRATDEISIVVSDTFRSTGGTVSAENIAVVGNNIEIVTDARTVVTEQGIRLVKLPVRNPMLSRLLAGASWTDREDRALQTATFAAGSTIVLTARNAITTAGAQITAGDNITLLAGGDITIGALALASETGKTSGSNRNRIERFDHLTTSLSADGDIMILSSGNVSGQNDIVLEGANVTAGGDVGLIAQGGDLILASVADVYFQDYARKSGGFLRKKIRREQTLNVTNQTTSITGASITGVADNNILVEGSSFTIPGVANTDLAPGQLALVSVNGGTAFTAPTDVRARSSYKSTRYLGGLITNSRDKRSLITDSVGAVADAAGDIAINSGADLTLTSVDFTAGGEFVTKVTGTTYLLAAIDVEYHSLTEHKDNGVIMTDIRSEDLTESVTFNAIEAAGGVNFDVNSQIILAGVRNPLIDSIQTGGWVADNEDSGRFNIADAYLGGSDETESTEDEASNDPHWREGGEWSEEGEFLVRQVALPTGDDGTEYAYLAGVLGRDSTINNPIELVSYNFYEKEQALSPAFKALLTIAVTQGLAGVGGLAGQLGMVNSATAATATSAATAATVTTTGLAVNAAAATTIVGVLDGAVAGDIDMGDILGEAAFAGVSAGLTAGIDGGAWLGDTGTKSWININPANGPAIFSTQGILDAMTDAVLTAGLSSAVYDTDFADSFKASLRSFAINQTTSALQFGVGELKAGTDLVDGGFGAALLHGAIGCAANEAFDGDCGSGFATGFTTEIIAGQLSANFEADPGTDAGAQEAARRAFEQNRAELIGAALGYLTSGGNAVNVNQGASVAKSAVTYNRQLHIQEAELIEIYAGVFAQEQNISLEEATALLTAETLIGASDDFTHLQSNAAARAFLNGLDQAGQVVDGQTLFGELDRQSEEYRNSTINMRDMERTNALLFGADIAAFDRALNLSVDDPNWDYVDPFAPTFLGAAASGAGADLTQFRGTYARSEAEGFFEANRLWGSVYAGIGQGLEQDYRTGLIDDTDFVSIGDSASSFRDAGAGVVQINKRNLGRLIQDGHVSLAEVRSATGVQFNPDGTTNVFWATQQDNLLDAAVVGAVSAGALTIRMMRSPRVSMDGPGVTTGMRVGNSEVPSGSAIVRDSTVRLDQNITTPDGQTILAGSVITESGGAIRVVTPGGVVITGRTADLMGAAPRIATNTGPVRIGETTTFGDSTRRAVVGDGLTGDHMPSRAALQSRVEADIGRPLTQAEATQLRNSTGCVIVSGGGHCALSNTFGGRNTPSRILNDAANPRAAADADFDAMIPDFQASGMTSAQINAARTRLHNLNGTIIDDINTQFGTQIRY